MLPGLLPLLGSLEGIGGNLGDLPILLSSPARNADGPDNLPVGNNWDPSFKRSRSRQGERAQADTTLRYQFLEHFARPSIIKRTMRLEFCNPDRAVLRVIELVQDYDVASAVKNDNGHRPIVLH